MLTVFMIDESPDHIYFVKSENYEQVLNARLLDKNEVRSQEVSLETMLLLMDNKSKVFILCLYKDEHCSI